MTTLIRACWILSCLSASVAAEPAPSQAAAEALAVIQGSGKACPPGWSNAAIEKVERLSVPSGTWHLAHITATGKPAGYVLLLLRGSALTPVMYSESPPPTKAMEYFSPRVAPSPLSTPPVVNTLAGVPMIAIPKLIADRSQVTPIACCIASMSMWAQEHHRLPFLYLPEETARTATRPFGLESPLLLPSPPPSTDELGAYRQKKAEVFSDSDLFEPLPSSSPLAGHARKLKAPSLQFDLSRKLMPLAQAELKKNLSPAARWELMSDDEFVSAAQLLAKPFTSEVGMVSAIVVQSYLWEAPTLEQGLEAFALARGMRSPWSYSDLADLRRDKLPCVLCGPEDQAVLLVGLSSDMKYGTVVVPETVQPITRSKKDSLQRMLARIEANDPDLPAQLRSPQFKKSLIDALRGDKASPGLDSVADPQTGDPLIAERGLHTARLDLFDRWRVLTINMANGH